MLKSKEFYYQELKQIFDSLAGNTNSFLNKTDGNLTGISHSLTNATFNLGNIKTAITQVKAGLKVQQKQKVELALGVLRLGSQRQQ